MRTPLIVLVAAMIAMPPVLASTPLRPDHDPALAGFRQAVEKYVTLHRTLAAGLPALRVSPDPDQNARTVAALAAAIRMARPDARCGDIFTQPGGQLIRARIRAMLDANVYDAAILLRSMADDGDIEAPAPKVNDSFDWETGNAMWPLLLAELPLVPDELEYRFVGRDLVLLDVNANLIVDILPAALPEQ